ncbi:MAG: S-layer homology domain-containing protein [candidate division WOR-3 bacterium]
MMVSTNSTAAILMVPRDSSTIQGAINMASPGDVIVVKPGRYVENVKVDKPGLTIKSMNGPGKTVVTASDSRKHVFEVTAHGVKIIGLTIEGAKEKYAAGIFLNEVRDGYIASNVFRRNFAGVATYKGSGHIIESNYFWKNSYGVGSTETEKDTCAAEQVISEWEGTTHGSASGSRILASLRDLRDFKLRPDYVELYYAYGPILKTILSENKQLSYRAFKILVKFYSPLRGLANGETVETFLIKQEDADEVVTFLEDVQAKVRDKKEKLQTDSYDQLLDFLEEIKEVARNSVGKDFSEVVQASCFTFTPRNSFRRYALDYKPEYNQRLVLGMGEGHVIRYNTFESNSHGVYLYETRGNLIYLNNFIDNETAYYSSVPGNILNSPEPVSYEYGWRTVRRHLGNFWSHLRTTDSNNDGVGDSGYTIGQETDCCPLVQRFEGYCGTVSFAIVTDLHIGYGIPDYGLEGYADDLLYVGDWDEYYLTQRVRKLVDWINSNKEKYKIEFVAILGDITDTAQRSQFMKAKEILNGLAVPFFPIIGNHDVAPYVLKAGTATDARKRDSTFGAGQPSSFYFRRHDIFPNSFITEQCSKLGVECVIDDVIGEHWLLNYYFDYKGVRFVFLDTSSREQIPGGTLPGVWWWGDLYEETKEFLKNAFLSHKDIVIFSHHPLRTVFTSGYLWGVGDDDVDFLAEVVKDSRSNVLANFAGHTHEDRTSESTGIRVIETPAVVGSSEVADVVRLVWVFSDKGKRQIDYSRGVGSFVPMCSCFMGSEKLDADLNPFFECKIADSRATCIGCFKPRSDVLGKIPIVSPCPLGPDDPDPDHDYVWRIYSDSRVTEMRGRKITISTSNLQAAVLEVIPRRGSAGAQRVWQRFSSLKPDLRFEDVLYVTTDWANEAIDWAVSRGITRGYPDGTFKPNSHVTREEASAFVMRARYGETFSYGSTQYFADVPPERWSFKYVQRLYEDKITKGCADNLFCPGAEVTRAEMAALLVRALIGDDFDYLREAYFSDVPQDHWAFKYVQKLRELGLTTGYPDGTFRPEVPLTRAEAVTFLQRAFSSSSTLFSFPVRSADESKLRYWYGAYYAENKAHAGVDIGDNELEELEVIAAYPGRVVGIYVPEPACNKDNNTASCNVEAYTLYKEPYDGGPFNKAKISDHKMQGVVILEHKLPDGTTVYSLYAHLNEIEASILEKLGKEVETGTLLGIVQYKQGGLRHLHFEIKCEPYRHNPSYNRSSDGPHWGYVPGRPEKFGYFDPVAFFHAANNVREKKVTVVTDGVNLRSGPSVTYRSLLTLRSGQNLIAFREAMVTSSNCKRGWYQVRREDEEFFVDETSQKKGLYGWVCKDYVEDVPE